MAHHCGMFTPARLRITAALLASVLGLVVTPDLPVGGLLDAPLVMQTPQR